MEGSPVRRSVSPAATSGTPLRGVVIDVGGADELVELFDGATLDGWRAAPRLPVPGWPGGPEPEIGSARLEAAAGTVGRWTVEDGAIVGTQDPPGSGLGGYPVTEDRYADFELTFEV